MQAIIIIIYIYKKKYNEKLQALLGIKQSLQ